jgi:D-alanyl-D-alanine carboxypeptidase
LKEVNTSFDWGGGGLVSTVNDLDIFIGNLLKGNLFKQATTVETMIDFNSPGITKIEGSVINYGLGLQKKEIRDKLFIGHTGAYGCMMYYNIIDETSIILTINQAAAMQKAEWLLRKAVEILEELE